MATAVVRRARLGPPILVALVSQIPPILVRLGNKQIQRVVGFSARLLSPHPRHSVTTNRAALVIPALAAAFLANSSNNNRSQVDYSDPLPQQVQVVGCSGPPTIPTQDSDLGVLVQALGPEVVVSSGRATTSNSSNSRSRSLLDPPLPPQVAALEAERLVSATPIPTQLLVEVFLAHQIRRIATHLASKTTPNQRMASVGALASQIRTRTRTNPPGAIHLQDSANRVIKSRSREGFLAILRLTRMPVVVYLATRARTTTRVGEDSLVRPTINRTAAPCSVKSLRTAVAYSARVLQTTIRPARTCSVGLETILMQTRIRRSSLKRVDCLEIPTTTSRSQEGSSVVRLRIQVVVAFSAIARPTTSNQAVGFSTWGFQINNSHPSLLEEVSSGQAREATTLLDPASLATLHSSNSKHLQTSSNPNRPCRLPSLPRILMVALQSSLAYLRPLKFLVQSLPRSTRRTSRRKLRYYHTTR